MSGDYSFSLTPIVITFVGAIGAGLCTGILIGVYAFDRPTLSTMEAVIDVHWDRKYMREYCASAGYMKPPFESKLVDAEVLPARDGADVGTLVCYWRLVR